MRTCIGLRGPSRAKIALQRVGCGLENQVAVGTVRQMGLNLGSHRLRQATL